jgi:hypothetical protein
MMNWKGGGTKRSWPNLRYYPRFCPQGLRKTTKNLSQDRRPPDRDFNPGILEYVDRSTPTFDRVEYWKWSNDKTGKRKQEKADERTGKAVNVFVLMVAGGWRGKASLAVAARSAVDSLVGYWRCSQQNNISMTPSQRQTELRNQNVGTVVNLVCGCSSLIRCAVSSLN